MRIPALLASLSLSIAFASDLRAQVNNLPLAESIVQARQTNATLMKQYSWNCRTELIEDGKIKETRLESVLFGPTGALQYTQISDQAQALPGGPLRRHLAEKDQEKLAAFIKELRGFLDQYTLPTTGKMLDFINQTFMPAPDPNGLLQLTGSGVVIPGDSLSLTLSASTKATQRMTILSYFQGDQVNVTAVFKTLTSGLNYVSFAEVDVPKKNMSLQIQNFDYINQKN